MRYELEYAIVRRYGVEGVFEKERGTVYFEDVHQAQEFCSSPTDMLEWFGADSGRFELWRSEPLQLQWHLKADMEGVNYLPWNFREFRDAIYGKEVA